MYLAHANEQVGRLLDKEVGPRNTDLGKLHEKGWHARLRLSSLPKREGNHHSSEEVSDGVVKERVLGKPASTLQQCQQSWKGAHEDEGRQHQNDGTAFVFDDEHLEDGCVIGPNLKTRESNSSM